MLSRCKITVIVLLMCVCFILSCGSARIPKDQTKIKFSEIWLYVMSGEEDALNNIEPVTDICYFSAYLNYRGKFTMPQKKFLFPASVRNKRKHLMISEITNSAILHFALSREYKLRTKLIKDIVYESKNYDGIQIDFEAVQLDDAENYISFIRDLRDSLPRTVILSIALPPRKSTNKDPYMYHDIGTIVDRVIVMAYDEHWSTSKPGPIASLEWCNKVAHFAMDEIPAEKLIMGLPLYGRAWQRGGFAKAMRYYPTMDLIKKKKISVKRDNGYPHFSFTDSVYVDVFYEDVKSLSAKCRMYRGLGIDKVSFWRIGQGPNDLWNILQTEDQR